MEYKGGRPGDPRGADGEAMARAMPTTYVGVNETRVAIYTQGSQQGTQVYLPIQHELGLTLALSTRLGGDQSV